MRIRFFYSSFILIFVVACIPIQKKSRDSIVQKNEAKTQCCWCVLRDGENEVGQYLSETACNNRFKTGSYKKCGLVEIKEHTCDFFSLSEGGATCKKRYLTYYDNNQPKRISPPSFIPEICKPRQGASMQIEWEEEDEEEEFNREREMSEEEEEEEAFQRDNRGLIR